MIIDYIIVIDKYEIASEQRREYKFTSPRLGRVGDIKDEIEIVNGKIKITKKIESNGTGNYFPKSEPEILTPELKGIRNTVAGSENDIMLFKDINWITIKELHRDLQSNIYMKYLQNNSLNTALVTHSKMNSEIAILQGEISLKVSKDNLVAEINMQPEAIKIDAKNININGVLSANSNFEVDLEGNMICNNARVNGDLVVGNGVYSMLQFNYVQVTRADGGDSSGIAGREPVGYLNFFGESAWRKGIHLYYYIPDNFTISKATLVLVHVPNKYQAWENGVKTWTGYGACRDLRLFRLETKDETFVSYKLGSASDPRTVHGTSVLNVGSFTIPTSDATAKPETKIFDVTSQVVGKSGKLSVAPNVESFIPTQQVGMLDDKEVLQKTANMEMYLFVEGYLGKGS